MKLAKIIITDHKFCCEHCRCNAIEINVINGVYEVEGCPICHGVINRIEDKEHFWKIAASFGNFLYEKSSCEKGKC